MNRSTTSAPARIWRQPRTCLACAAVLFAALFVFRLEDARSAIPIVSLYALPTALLAVTFGRVGGLGGATVATVLYAGWVVIAAPRTAPLGWLVPLVSVFLLGGLLGAASEQTVALSGQLVAHERAQLRLEARQRQHVRALEINDVIIQTLAVAKWKIEAGDIDTGLELVTSVIQDAQTIVSDLLPATLTADTNTVDIDADT